MNTVDLTKIVERQFNILLKKEALTSQSLFDALAIVAKESYHLGEIDYKIDTIFEITQPVSDRSI